MLEVKNLTKSFSDSNLILENVNLNFQKGTIKGLYGENGTGKSTFLRLLSSIYYPNRGGIFFDGKNIFNLRGYRGKVISVNSQTRNLYERLTGFQNISFFKTLLTINTEKNRFYEMAEELNIINDLSRAVSTYSLGMKQKLHILINFLRDGNVILLDEFTDHLDEKSINFLHTHIKKYFVNKNKIVIYASKNRFPLDNTCDDVLTIRDKKII